MNVSPITIVFTLLGGLILAAILGWVRRPRLNVLVPRLFTHSNLTNRGQLVEISVFNRGFKTEEAVELLLNPNLQYELVGANSPDALQSKGKLNIPRIGAGDEVTILLLVEGGTFTNHDIVSCLSKESKGEVVAKLDQLPPTGPQRIGLVAFFIVVPSLLYAMSFVLDYLLDKGPLTKWLAMLETSEENTSKDLQGWTVPSFYQRASASLFNEFANQKITVSILKPLRKRDFFTVPIMVSNHTTTPITYTLSINAPGSQDRVPLEERRRSDQMIVPGARVEARVTAMVPVRTATQGEKTVYVECFLESTNGESLKLTRLLTAE